MVFDAAVCFYLILFQANSFLHEISVVKTLAILLAILTLFTTGRKNEQVDILNHSVFSARMIFFLDYKVDEVSKSLPIIINMFTKLSTKFSFLEYYPLLITTFDPSILFSTISYFKGF